MSALWAMEKRRARVSTASGGSVPDCSISAGIDATLSNVSVCDQSTRPSSLPSKRRPLVDGTPQLPDGRLRQRCGRGQRGGQLLVRAAGQPHGLAYPQADHVRGLRGRVVDGLGELDALPEQLPFPFRGLLSPDPFEPGDEADGGDDGIHRHHPGEQGLLLAGIEVETGANHQADDGIDGPGHRRPGEAEPQGREDDREQRQGGIVGHVAEEVEVAADDDDGSDQRDVHAAEEEQPAPRHRPVPPEPVVDEPVERQQRHAQKQVLLVGGVPEPRSIGQFEHGDEPAEPAHPDRDPRGVQHHVRVGPDGPEDPPAQFGAECGRAASPPPQPALRCCGGGTRSAETVL